MEKVRKVLDMPIQRGYINWERLEHKLHAVLNTVDNKFDRIRGPEGEQPIKLEDAVLFNITVNGSAYTYKLYELRFKNGDLWCGGFEMGFGKGQDVIWNHGSLRRF